MADREYSGTDANVGRPIPKVGARVRRRWRGSVTTYVGYITEVLGPDLYEVTWQLPISVKTIDHAADLEFT